MHHAIGRDRAPTPDAVATVCYMQLNATACGGMLLPT
eukprot:CAMPEP_0172889502 /NCGR_PEP_ID=MMETSP1075-20121228/139022_1 /TAXON_ID=2916 /ORGANISM="Ceratium fusus, Strain PA161109" /LENGTH=36 /DNA_ID= /DNA_START= /DNA_END= /DNA_ORIENTATION=